MFNVKNKDTIYYEHYFRLALIGSKSTMETPEQYENTKDTKGA